MSQKCKSQRVKLPQIYRARHDVLQMKLMDERLQQVRRSVDFEIRRLDRGCYDLETDYCEQVKGTRYFRKYPESPTFQSFDEITRSYKLTKLQVQQPSGLKRRLQSVNVCMDLREQVNQEVNKSMQL